MTQKSSEGAARENEQLKKDICFVCYRSFGLGILALCLFLCIPAGIAPVSHSVSPMPLVMGPFPMPLPDPDDNTEEKEASETFPMPEGIEKQVEFWKKIFTEYTTGQAVIHDDWYLGVVYDVIDLESKAFQNRKEGLKFAREVREKYRAILEKLSEDWENPQDMTEEEARVYSLFKDIPESPYFRKTDAKNRVHLQVGQSDSFRIGIIRSGSYLDTMKNIFAKHKLPEELVYLPMIESTFNPFSVSHVGAAGMWQFMKGTGKCYDLTIDNMVDERRDPFRATVAAARLLAYNYKILKSWSLAITAYNYGLQGMRNAVKSVQSENIADIIERFDGSRFGFASRNFYVEFLAAKDVFEQYSEYYGDIELNDPLILTRIKLPEYIAIETFEKYCQVPISELKKLNPAIHSSAFQSGGFIPKEYPINILPDNKELILSGYSEIPDDLKHDYIPSQVKHRIRKSQTLSGIAKMYNTSVNKLIRLNGLRNPQQIRRGQLLKIPDKYISSDETMEVLAEKKLSPRSLPKHRVRRGETLSEIAKKYNTDISTFKQLNAIKNPQKIRCGQWLKIPEG